MEQFTLDPHIFQSSSYPGIRFPFVIRSVAKTTDPLVISEIMSLSSLSYK